MWWLVILLVLGAASAQTLTTTVNVTMRDGVKLNTLVYLNSSNPRPTVVVRTPYGASTQTFSITSFVALGYHAIIQDARGLGLSQGKYDFWNTSAPDAYDTMAWVVNQSWSNQIIFGYGGSAMGIATYLEAPAQPPWLKGQLVHVATANMYETVYQGGEYTNATVSDYLSLIGQASYIPTVLGNEAYSVNWTQLNLNDGNKWQDIKWPAVHIAGWNDIFLQPQLNAFQSYRTASSSALKDFNFLVVGPHGHCFSSQIVWPNGEYETVIGNLLAEFMFGALAGGNETIAQQVLAPIAAFSRIFYYIQGPNNTDLTAQGNYWTNATTDFPTANYTDHFLQPGGNLSTSPPIDPAAQSNFTYDPTNPVPTLGGNNLVLPQCGPWDQRELEKRPDVLVFTSQPLSQAMAITGRLFANLFVSSSAVDTDFAVKLIDVWPTGESMLIQDGILRMKWRENNTTPVLMTAGQVYNITVDVWSTAYIFNVGHSIRVDISSSNAPRFAANPNTGLPISDVSQSPVNATNVIYHNSAYPSKFTLPVVPIPVALNPALLLALPTPTMAPITTGSGSTTTSTSTTTSAPTPIPTLSPSSAPTPVPTSPSSSSSRLSCGILFALLASLLNWA